MPFMQRLTWSGVALHRGRVPPFPASHGCVRIPKGMASTVFGKTRFGTHVIISAEELVPRPASHYNLFQPAEYNEVVASLRPVITHKFAVKKSDSSVNSDGKREPLRIYATRTSRKDKTLAIQRMLQEAGFGAGKPDGIYGRNTIKAVRAFQYFQGLKPTGTATEETLKRLRSVTYSQGVPDGILYVRQKHKPVYEAGFTIRNPQEPLGTHLALLAGLNEERADWISLTVPTRLKKTTIRDHGIDPVYRKQKVGVSIRIALDRIELPREARDFISQRLAPGTSFAISDNGLGTETGKGTDFIVQTY